MKIGITTFYYKTYNYGANLQAYALCKVLGKLGFDAEQIRFYPTSGFVRNRENLISSIVYVGKSLIWSVLNYFNHPIRDLKYHYRYVTRCRSVDKFCREFTPHSGRIYTAKNIGKSIKYYDGYITGSDVVWSPITSSSIHFLRFVNDNKFKIAYAPSLGTDRLTEDQKKQLSIDLRRFDAISLREGKGVELIRELTDKNVEQCLDSTLLLDVDDWNVITSKRICNKKYIFCYFLGNNNYARNLAIEFANKRGFLVVNIAYYWERYKYIDDYGDIKMYDVSPNDFLSLIKYAEYIFTDSFHAIVFSTIFERNFYAFRRNINDPLNDRLNDFLLNINCRSQYIDSDNKESMEYISKNDVVDYKVSGLRNITGLIEKSLLYLKTNIQNNV